MKKIVAALSVTASLLVAAAAQAALRSQAAAAAPCRREGLAAQHACRRRPRLHKEARVRRGAGAGSGSTQEDGFTRCGAAQQLLLNQQVTAAAKGWQHG